MVSLFHHLYHVTRNCANLNNTDRNFPDFENNHLYYDNDDDHHLTIPVYSVIKPSMGPSFILGALLSLGIFSTESELLLNDTLRGSFHNENFVGEEDDPKSLQRYLNQVMNFFVSNQIVLFPNG